MLELLSNLGQGDTRKLVCFDADAADIDPKCIADAPQISFIDGEHTHRAVLSDYRFCASVMAGSGTIIFHDFDLVFPALYEICNMLKRRKSPCVPLKLDDNLGALFFEPQIIFTDPYLLRLYQQNRHYIRRYHHARRLRIYLPPRVMGLLWKLYQRLAKCH